MTVTPEAATAEVAVAPASESVAGVRTWPWAFDRGLVWVLAGAIVALASVLRLDNLGGKSLWLDEIIGSQATTFKSAGDLIAWVKADVDQMPGYPLLNWLLRGLGDGEAVLRLPAAIAGILSIVALFFLARRLFDAQTALIAALLLAINPFAQWHSQDARSYSLLMLLTTLQMLFAYRARRESSLLDWSALTVVTILNMYTHYMALAVTAAAYAYIVLGLLVDSRNRTVAVRQAFRAAGSVAFVGLAYTPWLHALSALLRSNNKGFARYGADGQVTIGQAASLLNQFGFSGLLLVALAAGLVAVAVRIARSARSPDGAALMATWVLVPIAGLAVVMRGSILYLDPRYLSFLVPALVLLCGVGVTDVARLVASRVGAKVPPARDVRSAGAIAAAVIAGLLVLQSIPALADSLQTPKDDYRGMAAYVTAMSPPGSMVVALGHYSTFIVTGLDHYLRETRSPIVVVDAASMPTQAAVVPAGGQDWGAVFEPSQHEIVTAEQRGFQVNVAFTHMVLVKPDPSLPQAEQLASLLAWDSP